jgi:3-oxoadipate enol-lactonase
MSVPRIVAALTPGPAGALPIVLGPSLGTTTTLWSWARPQLAAEHPLLAWDLPGHGASPTPAEGFTVEELAQGVLAAADEAGLDRFAIAGVSLGGLTALAVALAAPERVAAVAMLASLPRIATADAWHDRAQTVRQQGTPVLVRGSAERWFAPGFIAEAPSVAGRLLDELMTIDDEGYARCCEALAAADLTGALAELRVPLTLMPGDGDVVVGADAAQAVVDAVPGAQLRVQRGAGHLPPAERPAQAATSILESVGAHR